MKLLIMPNHEKKNIKTQQKMETFKISDKMNDWLRILKQKNNWRSLCVSIIYNIINADVVSMYMLQFKIKFVCLLTLLIHWFMNN